jgi:6-phosphogluconolactonase (cycloisomerase 2 family)
VNFQDRPREFHPKVRRSSGPRPARPNDDLGMERGMRQGSRIVSLLAVVVTSILLVSCGQSSNCSGISFGSTGSSASGGRINSGGSVCGGGSNNNGGGNTSASAIVYYIGGGAVIDAATITSATFANVNGFTPGTFPSGTGLSHDMIVVNKKFLYVPVALNGIQGAVQAYAINTGTAALTTVSGTPFNTGSAETGPVTTDPEGRFLFVGDTANSMIAVFQIDASTGALTAAPGSPFSVPGLAPHSFAVDGSGTYLYSANTNVTEVFGFNIDQNTGAISPVLGSPFGVGLAAIQGEPTGKFLLGVDGSTASLFVFNIEAGTGTLLPGPASPTANAAYALAVHPSGSFVYTFSADARGHALPLEGFQLDASGNATALTGSPFTTLPSVLAGKIDQGGTHLVAPVSTGAFAAFSVNSTTGALSNPVPNLNAVNDGNFTVTN